MPGQASCDSYSLRGRVSAGHSTAIWLTSNANVSTMTFDSLDLDYSSRCKDALELKFSGRINFFVGYSTKTVPTLASMANKTICDLLHVDGDHTTLGTYTDFYNFVQGGLVECGTLFLMDDVCDAHKCHCHTKDHKPYGECAHPTRALEFMRLQKLVKVLDRYFKYQINDRGWILGQIACKAGETTVPRWPEPDAKLLLSMPIRYQNMRKTG